jgi:hypothetical protein
MQNSVEDQVLTCAAEQTQRDMPYVEVEGTSLHKKVETYGERPDVSVQGVRWYVEVEVRNMNDDTTAMVLCRVWRDEEGGLKAVRVTIV